MSHCGPRIQPTRQPVMPWLLETELTTSVRSAMPGIDSGEMCVPLACVQ